MNMSKDEYLKSDFKDLKILLVGTGSMAGEHFKALQNNGVLIDNIQVVGRSHDKADSFSKVFNVKAVSGGLDGLASIKNCDAAIVAVSHDQLAPVTMRLLKNNYKHILIEKPGALYLSELLELMQAADEKKSRIYVAFNRRFYSSVDATKKIIKEDGGLISCAFDFTELEHLILKEQMQKNLSANVLQRWGIVNSFHVIDLFLYFSGIPKKINVMINGNMEWHPTGAVYCGSGITDKNVMFSYVANWKGVSRWGIELSTLKHKLVLRPLEGLFVQNKGSFDLIPYELHSEPKEYKPGFCEQLRAFLSNILRNSSDERLCSIHEAKRHYEIAEQILGYKCIR